MSETRYTGRDVKAAILASQDYISLEDLDLSPEELPEWQAQEAYGKEVLKSAYLVWSERAIAPYAHTLENINSPVLVWDAGYIGTSQAYRLVALRQRKGDAQ